MQGRYLFRGKQVDSGQWFVGTLTEGKSWKHKGLAPHICTNTNGKLLLNEVIENTIGQCTGLRDKNGMLIFEGDIVENSKAIFGEVFWNVELAMFETTNLKYRGPKIYKLSGFSPYHYENEAVVIGNIHDNPELMEVRNEGNR